MRTVAVLLASCALCACSSNSHIFSAAQIACQNKQAIKVAIHTQVHGDDAIGSWYDVVTTAIDDLCQYLGVISNAP